MSQPHADSPVFATLSTEGWPAGPKPPSEGWSRKKFLFVLAFVLVLHVVLIFLFGTKKQIVPRPLVNVPHLTLTDSADEFITLGDPTLFARPNAHDLVTGFWRRLPAISQPNFNYPEAPHYLPPETANFAVLFRDYVRSNQDAPFPLNYTPEPKMTAPIVAAEDFMPQTTMMEIAGGLAGRPLLKSVALPSLPRNDVLPPSHLQALVDTAGNVASAVVLEPGTDAAADQLALELVRGLRFAPAPALAFGQITFTWHTVPTNGVPASVP